VDINIREEPTVGYMLAKLFAQNPDSNSREMEITCLKKCNSKLPPIGDNPDIYSSDRMVLQVGS
jgi:hypothetical protein